MSTKQRSSTRNIKLSKAFRVVDEDTRRAVREQRLQQLESDNYVEAETMGRDDEDFEDEDDDGHRKKKSKVSKVRDPRNKWENRQVKSLEKIMMENGWSYEVIYSNLNGTYPPPDPTYYSIATEPPKVSQNLPLCSVCGYLSPGRCTRCGMRFCSSKCGETHAETRCLKFSM